MQREFLQEKSLNRRLDNAEKALNVDLSAKSRLIPYSVAANMLGLNDLYIQERDACENYRMIFTVNPVCTNALFNAVTEPVYLEGSYSAVSLVESAISRDNRDIFPEGVMNQSADTNGSVFNVDQIAAIRDTEFSNERVGDFKYLCGYDIFNNHLLRTSDFNHVMMAGDEKNKKEFNTIFDFNIDYSGKTVERIIGESTGPVPYTGATREYIRMYQLDNIRTMYAAFYDELREVDGWFGFYNSGYINIPNGKLAGQSISVNKILSNEVPCGFVDMYPGRELYSFIPKVNRYKRRVERNWDCTIVYPYKNDYDMFNRLMIGFSGTSEEWDGWKEGNMSKVPNSVRIIDNKVVYNNVGDELIEMRSLLRHSLQPGDTVRLFYTTSVYSAASYSDIYRFSSPVQVVSVGNQNGNETNRYFTVKLLDLRTFCGIHVDPETSAKTVCSLDTSGEVTNKELSFFYRKIENGCDDKYYFRKFKQLSDYSYEQCIPETKDWNDAVASAITAIREPAVIGDKSPEYIKLGNDYFKKIVKPLEYTQNKIAFAENIYGDRVAQVIFTDDIDTAGLKDNLGRPLSKVYFTVEKTNRGHKEWYEQGDLSADTVEFSHCFGDVTSGLDLPDDISDFNVRKLYNVFSGQCASGYSDGLKVILEDAPSGSYIDGTPLPIESAITVSDYDEFYGDIVEFNRPTFNETVIEKVYHRFNTAQRECLVNKNYYDIHYDELVGDLYDVKELE